MCGRLRVRDGVHRRELNLFVIQRCAHDVPSDTAEAVDTYLDGHSSSEWDGASGRATMQTSATLRNLKCYGLRQQKSTQAKSREKVSLQFALNLTLEVPPGSPHRNAHVTYIYDLAQHFSDFLEYVFQSEEPRTKKAYCGYCLMLVTRSPMKRTKTVFEGG